MLLDLRDELVAWRKTGTRFALATVVRLEVRPDQLVPSWPWLRTARSAAASRAAASGAVYEWLPQIRRPPWRLCSTAGRMCSIPQRALVFTVDSSQYKLGGNPWRPLTIHPTRDRLVLFNRRSCR